MPEENIEKVTKSYCSFAPTFADHNVLPHIDFNKQRLIKQILL